MTYRTAADKLKIYQYQMSQDFEFSEDVLVIRNSFTTHDGKFSKEEEKIEHVPHKVSQDDIKQVLNFFDIVMYKRFL